MIVSILAFFVLLYLVVLIVEALLNWFGTFFVPPRLGGGEEIGNPGLLNLAVRAILASGLSAIGAFMVIERIFSDANPKFVAMAFAIAVVIWAGFFVHVGFSSGVILEPLSLVAFGAAPASIVAFIAGRGTF